MTEAADARTKDQKCFARDVDEFLGFLGEIRNLSPQTIRAYRTDLDAYLLWTEREGVMPHEVTHRQLRSYLFELKRAGYATTTIDRHLSALRSCYKWLLGEGRIASDAAEAVSGPKRAKRLPHAMSDSEADRIIEACPDTPEGMRDRAFLELLYATGARISEAAALDMADIDSEQMLVHLFGKGSKERIVPIYRSALEAVERYERKARPIFLAGAEGETDALFLSVHGRRMSADALRRRFRRALAQAEVDPTYTPHSLRHAFATELLSGGADMRSVQELLGHESLATTQIYTHLSIDRLKDATHTAHPRG
ncbi:MAG: tyrosine recombinase [Atopobiaceae bacterium]